MSYLGLIGTVTLIHLLALIAPGPDFIMAVKNSISYGRRAGIFTAVGFGSGIAIHILYCVLGLAFIISKSIIVFSIIKFLGAGYLIYIGIRSIISKSSKIEVSVDETKKRLSDLSAFKSGFLTNVLNPKATILMLSLFTMVISPDTPSYVLLILSIIMVAITIARFSLVSYFFTTQKVQNIYSKFQSAINKTFGGLLILLGIKVALTHK